MTISDADLCPIAGEMLAHISELGGKLQGFCDSPGKVTPVRRMLCNRFLDRSSSFVHVSQLLVGRKQCRDALKLVVDASLYLGAADFSATYEGVITDRPGEVDPTYRAWKRQQREMQARSGPPRMQMRPVVPEAPRVIRRKKETDK